METSNARLSSSLEVTHTAERRPIKLVALSSVSSRQLASRKVAALTFVRGRAGPLTGGTGTRMSTDAHAARDKIEG